MPSSTSFSPTPLAYGTGRGTCTGKHGIGEGKKHFLVPEYGEVAVGMMRTLKHAFDPDGIMNPARVV